MNLDLPTSFFHRNNENTDQFDTKSNDEDLYQYQDVTDTTGIQLNLPVAERIAKL